VRPGANGRESTADENVPVPGPPRRLILLYEMPSPSSDWTARQPHARWVARMTKRPAPTGAGKSASEQEALHRGPQR
jgi:hypothetical protein